MAPFEEFIMGLDWRLTDPPFKVKLENGFMSRRIKAFQASIGSNLLMSDYEFFRNNPLLILQTIERFIGVKPFCCDENFDNLIVNAGGGKNFRILSRLLNSEPVTRIVSRLFPWKTLKKTRNFMTRLSKTPFSAGAKKMAEGFFQNDDGFVERTTRSFSV